MHYRFVKPDEVRTEFRKQDALSADIQALASEIDVKQRGDDDTADAAKRAKELRAEAAKRLKAEKVSDDEIKTSRVTWLRQWIEGMEREHAAHGTQLELKRARGEDHSPHVLAIEQIEKAHAEALVQLDVLAPDGTGDEVTPGPPPKPNRAGRRAVPRRASTS